MDGFEARCGATLAVFAALMSISDLFAGKYGDDEIMLTAEKGAAYQWYQSKSIKESLVEGEHDLLITLRDAGAVAAGSRSAIDTRITSLEKKSAKYEKQKTEILEGSAVVGEANWSQDKDGKMGQIVGAKEHEANLSRLGAAGDWFDYATLFYQLALVMGAISLVMKVDKVRNVFFAMLVLLGLLAAGLSTAAFLTLS